MQKIRKLAGWTLVVLVVLIIVYLIGPKTEKADFSGDLPVIEGNLEGIEQRVAENENQWDIRPDNEARIIWYDSAKTMTEYAIVYLHGFTASQEEGDPGHQEIARAYGCNLFLSRLSMHGLVSDDHLLELTANNYWECAKEALAFGKKIGKKVILMGTSTGGTLALQLAAVFPYDVAGLILLSPNIEINDPNAWLLNNPWGVQIARVVLGGKYITSEDTSEMYRKYWSSPYRIEGASALQELVEESMHSETFTNITQPLLLLYYYRNEDEQDDVVRVDAMLEMFDAISTPDGKKVAHPIPGAADHVIGSYIKSKDYQSVIQYAKQFMETVMELDAIIVDDIESAENVQM